jgi:hypothetical protein
MKQTQSSSIGCSSKLRTLSGAVPHWSAGLLFFAFGAQACGGRMDIATELTEDALRTPAAVPPRDTGFAVPAATLAPSSNSMQKANGDCVNPAASRPVGKCSGFWHCAGGSGPFSAGRFAIEPGTFNGEPRGSILTCETYGQSSTSRYSLDVLVCPTKGEEVEAYCGISLTPDGGAPCAFGASVSAVPAPTFTAEDCPNAVDPVPTPAPSVPEDCSYSVVDTSNGRCVGTWTCEGEPNTTLEVRSDGSTTCTIYLGPTITSPPGTAAFCPASAWQAQLFCAPYHGPG